MIGSILVGITGYLAGAGMMNTLMSSKSNKKNQGSEAWRLSKLAKNNPMLKRTFKFI